MLRRCLPWVGLVLLAVSFVCFVVFRPPAGSVAQSEPPAVEGEEPLVVVLDAGHGGQDSGAMCGSVMEKDLTLDVALRAELLLRTARLQDDPDPRRRSLPLAGGTRGGWQ